MILDTLRTVLKMRRAGLDAVLHPLIETHSLETPILESATGPAGYVQDAAQWPYFDDTEIGYGVKKAWALLNHIGHRLEPTPPLVAVVDSGFNLNEDLEAVESVQLLGEPSIRAQEESHGTQVAGVIAASKNNQTGVVGVAAEHSRLALFDYGTPILFRALQAISQAADSDATIINMSWSSAWPLFHKQHGPGALNEWFAALADKALLVAASGNDGIDLDSGLPITLWGKRCTLHGGLDSLKELRRTVTMEAMSMRQTLTYMRLFKFLDFRGPTMTGLQPTK